MKNDGYGVEEMLAYEKILSLNYSIDLWRLFLC